MAKKKRPEIKNTYTTVEISEFIGESERKIQRKAETERWPFEEIKKGCVSKRYYKFTGLPPDIRKAIMDQHKHFDALESIRGKRLSVSPDMLSKEKTRVMLDAYTQMQHVPEGFGKDEWVKVLAQRYGKSPATLYRWEARILKEGGVRSRKKKNILEPDIPARSFSPEALEWGRGVWLSDNGKTKRQVYELLQAEAIRNDWRIGSEKTFYRLMSQIPEPLVRFAQGGRKALEQEMPRLETDLTVFHVMERLVGDQHVFDYVCANADGGLSTPMCYAWVDLRSRYFPGVYPCISSYNAFDVGMSLRYACRFGIPAEIYTDNGKPELSAHIQQVRHQLSGLSVVGDIEISGANPKEEMGHRKAKVRNPQAKIIESLFYHALEAPLRKRGIPGYAKRSEDPYENDLIRKEINRLKRSGKLLSLEEFYSEVAAVIDEWNSHTLTTEPIVPEQYFFGHLDEAPIKHMDAATLDMIFLPAVTRTVRQSKIRLKLPGYGVCHFYSPELFPLSRSKGKRGKKVEVRYNPYDPSRVYVIDLESVELIAIADRWDKVNPKSGEQLAPKYREQHRVVAHWEKLFGRYTKNQGRVYRFSPMTRTAKQAEKLEKRRLEKASREQIDEALINLWEARKKKR